MYALNGYVPTGIIIYNGTQFPTLSGKVIFGSYSFQSLYIGSLNAALDSIISVSPWAITGRAVSISQGSDGNIYVLKYGFANEGAFLRIKPYETGLGQNEEPVSFRLTQNYPNPFNPLTIIKYEIPKSRLVTIKIYNTLGMEVTTLVNETKQHGSYEVTWDASNFPSGVYFYELSTGEFTERKKMVLVK